jgi:hypothetical protein
MNNWMILLFFVVDAMVVFFIIGGAIGSCWRPLSERYPQQPIGDGAFRKNFQSVAIGSISLGFSVHMAADDDYLHWIPAKLLRIFKCKTVSIPWSSIQPSANQPSIQKSLAFVSLLGLNKQMTIPRWCLEIKKTVEPTNSPT